MITYYEELSSENKEKLTSIITKLINQTYILERKYDKKNRRMQTNQDFRICDEHLEFLQEYFEVAGMQIKEDIGNGIIYLSSGESQSGPRLSEYTTKYILILKVIFDEQMSNASSSSFVAASRAEVQEKMAGFQLLSRQPGSSEIRNTIRLLKKYQIIDFLDNGDEESPDARFIIYPSLNMVLLGEDIKNLVNEYCVAESLTEGAEDGAEV